MKPIVIWKLGLSAFALFALFFFLEVALRIAGHVPSPAIHDPHLAWRYAPGASYVHRKESLSRGRFNRQGYNDDEFEHVRAYNYRIAFLGDSFLEALQVPRQENFCERVEMELAPRVTVMNFGRSGMGPVEELIVLNREALSYEPNAVVLYYLPGNDISDALPETALDQRRPFAHLDPSGAVSISYDFRHTKGYRVRRWISPVKRRSSLVSWLTAHFNEMSQRARFREQAEGDPQASNVDARLASLFTEQPDQVLQQAFALNLAVLGEIARRCELAGSQFLLVVLPSYTYVPDDELAQRGMSPQKIETQLMAWGLERRLPVLGLTSIFRQAHKTTGQDYHFDRTGHFNASGHALCADATASFLREHLDGLE